MASAFLSAGDEVSLLTSFPRDRFPGLPKGTVRSILWPEALFRFGKLIARESWGDQSKMKAFGKAMAARVALDPADLFIGWSSFALETLRQQNFTQSILVRDSAHVAFQTEVLKTEYERFGFAYPDRSICESRETLEYELADRILVPSKFAAMTFFKNGISEKKIQIIPLGVNSSLFHPPTEITSRLPLKLVYFGTLSIQKGVQHLLEATRRFSESEIELELIGSLTPEIGQMLGGFPHAKVRPAMKQGELAARLREKDVCILPTLHDGFGQVVPQAMASGLVTITTDHCGAADFIQPERNGFIVKAGDATPIEQLVARLVSDLPLVTRMRRAASVESASLSWARYADRIVWNGGTNYSSARQKR